MTADTCAVTQFHGVQNVLDLIAATLPEVIDNNNVGNCVVKTRPTPPPIVQTPPPVPSPPVQSPRQRRQPSPSPNPPPPPPPRQPNNDIFVHRWIPSNYVRAETTILYFLGRRTCHMVHATYI